MPWSQPHQGLVLVIDLWSGIGGLLVALLALGVRCIALSAEQSDTLRSSVHQHFPHVVHVKSVEELRGEMLRPVLSRRAFSAIFIGGGPPAKETRLSTSDVKVGRTHAPNNLATWLA